jgi:hypothetical protein
VCVTRGSWALVISAEAASAMTISALLFMERSPSSYLLRISSM